MMNVVTFLNFLVKIIGTQEDFILRTQKLSADVHLQDLDNKCNSDKMLEVMEEEHKCSPTPIRFPVTPPIFGNYTSILPNYITIKKCMGACQDYTCIPFAQRTVAKIVTVKSCNEHGCDQLCGHIILQEDLECRCKCPRVICNPNIEIFNKDTCECTCKDIHKKIKCLEMGHSWDNNKCICESSKFPGSHDVTMNCDSNYNLITSLVSIIFGLVAIAISIFCWLNIKYREYIVASNHERQ